MISSVSVLVKIIALAAGTIILLTAVSIIASGPRTSSPLENIHGIPFPTSKSSTLVTETLAHADIFLQEPPLAKQLRLTITFSPLTVTHLSVGIRENPFWLSYSRKDLYQASDGDGSQTYTRTLVFPLTDKIVDRDGSLDLMFFADYIGGQEDKRQADATAWRLDSMQAEVSPVLPAAAELKDYIRGLLKRERPL